MTAALAAGEIKTDLCIIGAGPAGISLALQFLQTGLRVLLVESGQRGGDPAAQTLGAGEVVNPALHCPPERYRRRGLGGSSSIWGGRCVPFDPQDFAPRPWLGLHTGWPVPYARMLHFWHQAQTLCELGAFEYDGARAVPGGMAPMLPGLRDRAVHADRIERFSPPTDFGRRYGPALRGAANIRLLEGATCTNITLTRDGQAVSAVLLARAGAPPITVRPRAVVLAMGGLEIPRLLLASRGRHPAGIGNQHDQVGRNYMCHIAGVLGRFEPAPGQRVNRGYVRDADGVYCRRRLSVTAAAQQAAAIGNAIVRLHHPRLSDPAHRSGAMSAIYLGRGLLPYEYAVRLQDGPPAASWRHAANVAADPSSVLGFAAHYVRTRRFAARRFPSLMLDPRAGGLALDVHAEQLPNPASRITLSTARDRLGVPQPRIDWRYLPQDIATVRGTLMLLASAVRRGGHGLLGWDDATLEADLLRDGAYGGHHLGTTRMSESPRHGVVDADCRVHGIVNLFVAGGAVFPTSGQANPTLTIVALSLRLAAHLHEAFAHGTLSRVAPDALRHAA